MLIQVQLINKPIYGSGVNHPNASNTIAIQDLVKCLNGSGLKVTNLFSSVKNDGRYIKIYRYPNY